MVDQEILREAVQRRIAYVYRLAPHVRQGQTQPGSFRREQLSTDVTLAVHEPHTPGAP